MPVPWLRYLSLLLLMTRYRYLASGNLADLTLNFGEKSRQIHKALACSHSKWFQKAVTGGFDVSSYGSEQGLSPNRIIGNV